MKPILKMVNAHGLVKEAVIASEKTCAVPRSKVDHRLMRTEYYQARSSTSERAPVSVSLRKAESRVSRDDDLLLAPRFLPPLRSGVAMTRPGKMPSHPTRCLPFCPKTR